MFIRSIVLTLSLLLLSTFSYAEVNPDDYIDSSWMPYNYEASQLKSSAKEKPLPEEPEAPPKEAQVSAIDPVYTQKPVTEKTSYPPTSPSPLPANLESENGAELFRQGLSYYTGDSVPQDYKKAFNLFQKAADLKTPEAQYYLGLLYFQGDGTTASNVKACMWFIVAEKNNVAEATEAKLKVLRQMNTWERNKARKLALRHR